MQGKTYKMPFGTELRKKGGVGFRLWAPDAEKVELCLEKNGAHQPLTMERNEEGWWKAVTEMAASGTLYRYMINNEWLVPDPASRFQPGGVHGPSQVINPAAWKWQDENWRGRPWSEAVIYELHIGTFSSKGTFGGVIDKLDYLASLGITAIELMPVAAFPGSRNWGYDGVLPFAPDRVYGTPAELKRLICEAHHRGLMVFLDVVYNHLGPVGNYLNLYSPQFFSDSFDTPWGCAINFCEEGSHWVRRFFIHNALYWLEEFNLDGLRFDAVHSIFDTSTPHIIEEIGSAVRNYFPEERHIHLVLENDKNEAHYLSRGGNDKTRYYKAQWNDDFHHAGHVIMTGEISGYYEDYRANPLHLFGRCLSEGFAYQGEASSYRNNQKRGELSKELPPAAFVSFLQNHDQIGNRAFGERLADLAATDSLKVFSAILMLSPNPPMLFMGQEWGARQPFQFFCDFEGELAKKVYKGRLREFSTFPDFNEKTGEIIPDPNDPEVFAKAKLDWGDHKKAVHREWLELHKHLLEIRRKEIVLYLAGFGGGAGEFQQFGAFGLLVNWSHQKKGALTLIANLGDQNEICPERFPGRLFFSWPEGTDFPVKGGKLPPLSVFYFSTLAETER